MANKSLQEILGGVQETTDTARDTIRTAETEASQELKELQTRVLAGEESTGSPLHDGVIALYGELLLNSEIVKRYEQVAAKLEGAQMLDPAVVITRWLEDAEHIGVGSQRTPRQYLSTSVMVGMLNGKELLFDLVEREVSLPTSQWAYKGRHSEPDIVIEGGRLSVDKPHAFPFGNSPSLGSNLDREIDMDVLMFTPPVEEGPILATEILIGYEDIQSWLAERGEWSLGRNGDFNSIRQLAKALQLRTIDPATEAQRRYLGTA